ncbi:MAG: Crp/Fnr family transcriptional regulator [Pseudomonadota bacterium]
MTLAPPNSALAGVGLTDASYCATCGIRRTSLCGALTVEEMSLLSPIARHKRLPAGQTFSFQGEESTAFANIEAGVAKLVRGAADGRTQIVGLLFQSDFLGSAALPQAPNEEPHSIIAVSDLDLCVFPRKPFETLVADHPTMENALLRRCVSELNLARDWMVLLGRKTAGERVASFLYYVAQKLQGRGCQPGEGFDLPLDRSEIADYIGLTTETVSRQITNLRKARVIELSTARHICRVDMEALKERTGF